MISKFLVPEPLNLTGDISKNWENFSREFDRFMKATELYSKREETKLAIFFNLIGKDAFEVFKTFKFRYQNKDNNPSLMTLDMVMDRFKKFCESRENNVIYNSGKFHERKQLPGENFNNYLKSITELAKFCDFESEERMLRDRIVTGVQNFELREKLIVMQDATLNNIIRYCREFEARNNASELLDEEEIYLFSYKIMKFKELDGGESNNNCYYTINVKDLTRSNEILFEDSGEKGKHDSTPINNLQCVPNNSDKEENSGNPGSEQELDDIEQQNDAIHEVENYKINNLFKLNPINKLTKENLVEKVGFKVQWEDIFSYCQQIPSDINLMSNESNDSEEFREIIFNNQSFSLNQNNAETEKIQPQEEEQNNKPDVLFSENIKHRLRKSNKTDLYKCQKCNKGFAYKNELSTHKKICSSNNRKRKEKEIGKKDLKFEIKQEMNYSRNIKCDVCGKVFTRPHNLKKHSLIHTGEKPFICDTCGRRFRCKVSLGTHLHSHLGIKPFKCDKCSKSFGYKSHLNTHLQRHAKEKIFSCSMCSKKFTTMAGLKVHSYTHTRPHKCSQCDKTFGQKFQLRKHLTSVHKFKCENV